MIIVHGLLTKREGRKKKKLCAVAVISRLVPTLVWECPMRGAGSFHLRYLIRMETSPCKILSDPSPRPPFHRIVPLPFGWNTS